MAAVTKKKAGMKNTLPIIMAPKTARKKGTSKMESSTSRSVGKKTVAKVQVLLAPLYHYAK